MKKIVLMFSMLMIFTSCSSDDSKPTDETGLIGKWKLIEQLADPGDGSGTFQPIASERVIEFFSDGTVAINGVLCFMSSEVGDKESGTYKLITDSDTQNDGEIIPNTCSSRSARVYFDLSVSGHLILWYQCIEGCGQKFEKLN
ncbi:hypothetical protein [Algibacter sp. 2305UL17-15]|uniref:hypothetical protein n=1 Tax=Algibacter sp. 2305UL17-15 TaxID=3231268 RepID=UPI003459E2A5